MNPHFLNKRLSHQLGYGGLLPFVSLTLGVWLVDPVWMHAFVQGQQAYATVILSFLGGLHWGVAMLGSSLTLQDTRIALWWGVTPSLIAWASTMFGGFSFAVLMAGFVLAYRVDKTMFPRYALPDWLPGLRARLTLIVVLSLMATVIGANLRG